MEVINDCDIAYMINSLIKTVKNIIHSILNYSIFVIYKCGGVSKRAGEPQENYEIRLITKEDIMNSDDALIYEQGWYGGEGSCIFACIVDERIVALCVYWYGDRYLTRNFWPLKEKEAKLVQVYTLPDVRGKGLAPMLIQYSADVMMEQGFVTLFARIWHSNHSSRKAFERSNWVAVSTVVEIQPVTGIKPFKFCINKKGFSRK